MLLCWNEGGRGSLRKSREVRGFHFEVRQWMADDQVWKPGIFGGEDRLHYQADRWLAG
jgi:hypothetical protein